MATSNQPGNKHSIQNILNWSFDSDYNVLAIGLLGYDGTVLRRIKANSDGEFVTEETLLLRRIVKLLESNAVVDSNMRQKVALDYPTTVISGTDYGIGYAAPNAITANAPSAGTSRPYLAVWCGVVDQRYEIIDRARTAYNLGIRNQLSFT